MRLSRSFNTSGAGLFLLIAWTGLYLFTGELIVADDATVRWCLRWPGSFGRTLAINPTESFVCAIGDEHSYPGQDLYHWLVKWGWSIGIGVLSGAILSIIKNSRGRFTK